MYYVYIITNQYNTVLYTGITNNIIRRTFEHKQKLIEGFTKKYNLNKLVYYEIFADVTEAIKRKKQIKGYTRVKKEYLITKMNTKWDDLYNKL